MLSLKWCVVTPTTPYRYVPSTVFTAATNTGRRQASLSTIPGVFLRCLVDRCLDDNGWTEEGKRHFVFCTTIAHHKNGTKRNLPRVCIYWTEKKQSADKNGLKGDRKNTSERACVSYTTVRPFGNFFRCYSSGTRSSSTTLVPVRSILFSNYVAL